MLVVNRPDRRLRRFYHTCISVRQKNKSSQSDNAKQEMKLRVTQRKYDKGNYFNSRLSEQCRGHWKSLTNLCLSLKINLYKFHLQFDFH